MPEPFFCKKKICKKKADDYSSACSGAKEDRTPDPLLAKQVLSQLSYNPIYYNSMRTVLIMEISGPEWT